MELQTSSDRKGQAQNLSQGAPVVALGGVYTGPLDKSEQALRPLREFGPPHGDAPFSSSASSSLSALSQFPQKATGAAIVITVRAARGAERPVGVGR
jgi:hypothetical protein